MAFNPVLCRRGLRWALRVVVVLLGLLFLAVLAGWFALRWSLPQLEGSASLDDLAAAVLIARDAQGVPTVTASNRLDLARATGWLHAQERFFQMDLSRRAAAGELSELMGPGLIDSDRYLRRHRLRPTARRAIEQATAAERALLEAYAEGATAGLAALKVRPPEYILLRQTPQPWAAEDSILVLHSMGLQLSDPEAAQETDIALAQETLPPSVFEFYVRPDTLNPAALDGSRPAPPRLPTAEEFDLRTRPAAPPTPASVQAPAVPGSNAWAVDGRRTGTGSGMLANDMHLGLRLPNVWYRMQLLWHEADGSRHRLVGATIPGTPAMVVGSNGRVAWGFTAAQLDVSDQVLLELDPAQTNACRVGDAWQAFEIFLEEIRVAGGSNVVAMIPWSPWGPVGTNALDQPVSYRWAMHLPEVSNFGLLAFEPAASVAELLEVAPACGLPWLNVIAADRDGAIGWTLGGRFPKRVGFDGRTPVSWADHTCRWEGWYEPAEMPRVFNPPSGAVWNANDAALGTATYRRLMGGDQTDNGARASQIRDQLLTLTNARPADLLAIQLDDRALLLAPWQQRLLAALDRAPQEPRFAEARPFVAHWGERAATDSVGYRLVSRFRDQVHSLFLAPVLARCSSEGHRVRWLPGHHDGVIEDLLAHQPPHLLPPPFATYDELLVDAARETLRWLPRDRPLAEWTWGNANWVQLRHPFGQVIPLLGRWLDLPGRPLPGDNQMPRVQGRDFGASQRLVVSPGREDEAIFHMPGGQSGHFLSPFYGAGHRDWEEGRASPLLPGPTHHVLVLRPPLSRGRRANRRPRGPYSHRSASSPGGSPASGRRRRSARCGSRRRNT
jgi:penicillin amidase